MVKTPYAMRLACLSLCAPLVGACSWGYGSTRGEVPEMHRNLSRAVDIQTAVVRGDLEKARDAASWLLGREGMMVPSEGARHYRDQMLEYAARIQASTNLRDVAAQAGQLAASCGSCHQATGGGPRFAVGSASPGGDSQEAQMVRHLWAADRMWEGLIGPSDEAWMAGAQAMAKTEPSLARALRSSPMGSGSGALFQELNRLANEAMTARDQTARADVYGRLIATCNLCHTSGGGRVER